MYNDFITSSHFLRDAIQVRCWQNTWASFAGPLSATSAIIFQLIFPPQVPELGRVGRGAVVLERNGGGMGLKEDARRSPSRAKFFPSFHKCSTAIYKIKEVEFLDTKIMPRQRIKRRLTRAPPALWLQEATMWPKSPGHIHLSQGCSACTQVVIPKLSIGPSPVQCLY